MVDERGRFEQWMGTQRIYGCDYNLATWGDGEYQSPVTASMWAAWQAARHQPNGGAGALPARDESKANNEQGLYRKFDVRRTDGSDAPGGKHAGCDYFVLDLTHDPLAKAAAQAYANAAEATHHDLARDMRERYGLAGAEDARDAAWLPIETAPRDGRQLVLLLTPSNWPQIAWSNTWWTAGFSVECKPTHWAPIPQPRPTMSDQNKGKV